MKERDFKDRTFQMTGKDLHAYGIHMVSAVLASLLAGLAEALIIDMAVEAPLVDLKGWAAIGVTGSNLLFILATSCAVFFLGKLLMERWLEKREVPSQGGEDEAAEAA